MEKAKLAFETLEFKQEEHTVKVNFLRIFYFHIPNKDLQSIADYTLTKNSITFSTSEKRAERKFNLLLEKGFKSLKNTINNKPAVYIHKNSGIPLIGNVSFGLVDRDTNIIEVKPITSCNLKCIYCSVDETKRPVDFVIEKDYIVEEFQKLVTLKNTENIEAHIASQGEPLLYADLADLIKDISRIPEVKTISIDTNGVMLSKEKVDDLVNAGLNRFNFSINAITQEKAEEIAGTSYNIKQILDIITYISKKTNIILTPVWIPGINDEELDKIIEFTKSLQKTSKHNITLGIQNFMNYRFGRNPVKQESLESFYSLLEKLEKKHNIKLIVKAEDFKITKTTPLPKPFKKGDIIKAELALQGRLEGEMIAVAGDRTISIPNCKKTSGTVKVRITRTKHNVFIGEFT